MNEDWILTGRHPAGICGATLYLSSHIHHVPCSKSDIFNSVHIAHQTILKRIMEFFFTKSANLNINQIEKKFDQHISNNLFFKPTLKRREDKSYINEDNEQTSLII